MPESDVKIVYKIDYTDQIRLSDLSYSFLGFDQQYNRHVKRYKGQLSDPKMRLYVKEITKGSIEATLFPLFAYSLIFPNDRNCIFEFVNNLSTFLDFLKGSVSKPPFHIERADIEQAKNIIKPAVKDYGSQLNIFAYDGANVQVHYNMNSIDAVSANEKANELLKNMDLPEKIILENQLLIFRMTEDTLTKKNNRGVIESISDNLVPVYTDDPEIRNAIIDNPDNPYKKIYLVDVEVKSYDGEPRLYNIIRLKDIFDRE